MTSLESEDEPKVRFVRRSLKGRIKLCPKCLSQMKLSGSLSGWLVPEEYLCEDCGYHGHVALELSQDENSSVDG
jgi:hypothetical protein